MHRFFIKPSTIPYLAFAVFVVWMSFVMLIVLFDIFLQFELGAYFYSFLGVTNIAVMVLFGFVIHRWFNS